MQFAASMPGVSSNQNHSGWQPSPKFTPRIGQKKLYDHVVFHPEQQVYNARLPTGYGKTACAFLTYGALRAAGRVNRLLIVVPSDQQRADFYSGVEENVAKIGLPICGYDICGEERALRRSERGTAEVLVTTIQHIAADLANLARTGRVMGYYGRLFAREKWLIVADEHHHYAHDKTWGEALKSLPWQAMLGLSATPLTSSGSASVVGNRFDVEVSIQEAYEEGAIRAIHGHISDYFVDISEENSPDIIRLTTEQLADESTFDNDDISTWETKRGIRYHGKYLSEILFSAVTCLNAKLSRHPGQHQMLVFAMSCRHAKFVCDTLNLLVGSSDGRFAEWIGTGPQGRQNQENLDILKRYKKGEISCLVQVDKAGEGFDNPRSSVLVFLNMLTAKANKATQQLGRGFRRNYGIKDFSEDTCDVFVSADSAMVPLIKTLSQEANPRKEGDPGDGDDDRPEVERFYTIPQLVVLNTELRYVETCYPMGSPEEAIAYLRAKAPQETANVSSEHLKNLIDQILFEKQQEIQKQTAGEQLNLIRDQVGSATSVLVGNAIKLRYGFSAEKTAAGDMKRAINAEWTRISQLTHSQMEEADFRRKHAWLREVNQTMLDTDTLPVWLRL